MKGWSLIGVMKVADMIRVQRENYLIVDESHANDPVSVQVDDDDDWSKANALYLPLYTKEMEQK